MKPIIATIKVPADKSITQRAIMIGALASGDTVIENFPQNESAILTAKAMRQYVDGDMSKPFYCGDSAFLARALCGILVGQEKDCDITGDKGLEKRPMKRVIEPIEMMDAGIISDDWHLPLKVLGGIKLHGICYTLPIPSAQVKTALLFAGLFAYGKTVIFEKYPSRNHTEILLKSFGADIKVEPWEESGRKITLNPGNELKGIKLHIPGDFSSAAFWIALALLVPGSELRINDVGLNETRTGFMDIAKRMGADIEILNLRVAGYCPQEEEFEELTGDIMIKSSSLQGVTVEGADIVRTIDELPLVALLAAFAEGKTVIKDAGELRSKECDRIEAVQKNLSAMGVNIEATDDGWIIEGKTDGYKPADIEDFGDHRIAMLMSIARAAIGADMQICDSVKKSYPEFYSVLERIAY